MKRLVYLTAVCFGLFAFNSCEKMSDEYQPFTFNPPGGTTSTFHFKSDGTDTKDGQARISASFLAPSDIEGCVFVSLFVSTGKMVDENVWLSMYLKEKSLVPGKEPEIERLDFGYFFSSDSRDYTGTFKGNIRVRKFNSEELVLRFNRVNFEVGKGTSRFNGDLVFTRRHETLEEFVGVM